jgi:hypothetical protein
VNLGPGDAKFYVQQLNTYKEHLEDFARGCVEDYWDDNWDGWDSPCCTFFEYDSPILFWKEGYFFYPPNFEKNHALYQKSFDTDSDSEDVSNDTDA